MLNERQEQFTLGVARGLSAAAAYLEAYNAKQSVAETNGPRLLRSAQVQARLAEVRADMAAAHKITLPFLTGMFLEVYRKSLGWGQGSAAAQAAANVAKMHGFMNDKSQLEITLRRPSASPESPDDMPEDTWLKQYSTVIDHIPQAEPQGSASDIENDAIENQNNSEPSIAEVFGDDYT